MLVSEILEPYLGQSMTYIQTYLIELVEFATEGAIVDVSMGGNEASTCEERRDGLHVGRGGMRPD